MTEAGPDSVAKHWPKPLSTRRFVGANCDVHFDFNWKVQMGHNQPSLKGLQDLTLALERRAAQLERTPILILTTEPQTPFREIFSEDLYIAVVDIDAFRCATSSHDRSALFFLEIFGALTSGVAATSEALQLLATAESEHLVRVVDELLDAKQGAGLLAGMLRVAQMGIKKQLETQDILELSSAFVSGPGAWLAATAQASRRSKAVADLQELIADGATENSFQTWFIDNSWVLGTNCVRILDERRINLKNTADYIVESLDGLADIVEIKRPGLTFWAKSKDHDNYVPHSDLVKAIVQAQNYQLELEKEMNNLATNKRLGGVQIAKPNSIVIHGRSAGWDAEQFTAQRILNAGLTNVTVLTYDQILKRAKAMTGLAPD